MTGRTVGPAIQIDGLTKDFGEGKVVFDLDLDVEAGEVLGFLGPNGAGKSTAMRTVLGLLRPSAGRARVLGGAATRSSTRRRVGYLAGDFALHPQLTGRVQLRRLASLHDVAATRRIDELAERFDADLDRPTRELSTGSRQKLGLIQAFMHRPDVLVLDEPIAGLDPLVQRRFHDLLLDARDTGVAVLLSSHTLSEVDRVADRVAVVRGGRLVLVDTLQHVRDAAVRSWEVDIADHVADGILESVAGVRSVERSGCRARITFEGPPTALLKALAVHEVRDLRTAGEDLEELFFDLYDAGAR